MPGIKAKAIEQERKRMDAGMGEKGPPDPGSSSDTGQLLAEG